MKRRYRSNLDAKLALARIGRKGGDQVREKSPVRSYRCPACSGWHLTSEQRRAGRG